MNKNYVEFYLGNTKQTKIKPMFSKQRNNNQTMSGKLWWGACRFWIEELDQAVGVSVQANGGGKFWALVPARPPCWKHREKPSCVCFLRHNSTKVLVGSLLYYMVSISLAYFSLFFLKKWPRSIEAGCIVSDSLSFCCMFTKSTICLLSDA